MLNTLLDLSARMDRLAWWIAFARLRLLLDRIELAEGDEREEAIQEMREAIDAKMEERCSS